MISALALLVSCGTVTKIGQTTTDISNGASTLENSANSIDRAIATGERVKERFETKK